MKLQCKVQVLQAGQYDNSLQTGHRVYVDDCYKLCNIISNVYINVAVKGFVKEHKILHCSICKQEAAYPRQAVPSHQASGLASNLKSIWWHVSEPPQP